MSQQLAGYAPWPSAGERSLFDRLPDASLVVQTQTGRIADCNAAMLEMLGCAADDLLGRPVTALAASADLNRHPEAWTQLQSGGTFRDLDLVARSRQGRLYRLSASGMPLPPTQGNASRHGLAVLRDLSRHRRAEREMRAQVRQWRRSAVEAMFVQGRERERIAAGLHDEIGQMLAMIGFKLGELGRLTASEPGAGLITELSALVRQAAQATRTATFELSNPLLEQLGLRAALESVAQAAEKSHHLCVDIEGDAPRLHEPVLGVTFRVLKELLFNVQKHASASCVHLRLQMIDAEFRVEMVDDGVGFDIGPGLRRYGPQGGYGLVNARSMMQAIGGHLQLRSAPGAGTAATLVLPMTAAGARDRFSAKHAQ